MTDRRVTAELLARHDVRGPRYTSYPTAVEFKAPGEGGVGPGEYAALLAAADEARGAPLSVYVHLPFCERRCLFCGCHVIAAPLTASRSRAKAAGYLDVVLREAELVAERLPHRRSLAQLHLGGGTPTYHEPAELERLARGLLALFPPVPGAELACEVDPRVTRPEHLDALARHGFDRVSLGVQDLDPDVQAAIARDQTRDETARVVAAARAAGFRGLNVDLVYGLPRQTVASFEGTVEEAVALGADRFAIYSFAHLPEQRRNQRAIDADELPTREEKHALFAAARERLLAAGYEPIGMDHFAVRGDELAAARREGRLRRNFQGYTTLPATDVIGLGVSAIGDVRGGLVQNAKELAPWRAAIEAGRLAAERGVVRSADDELRRDVIEALMCNFEVDVPAVEARHGIDFAEAFTRELALLAEHERQGLVELSPRRIAATDVGRLFVRNLAMCFDRYRRGPISSDAGFSRTV